MSNQCITDCTACNNRIQSQERLIDYLRRENSDQGNEITNLSNDNATLRHQLEETKRRLRVAYHLYETTINHSTTEDRRCFKENCHVK